MASMNEIYGYGPSLARPPFPIEGNEEIVDPWYPEAHQNIMDNNGYNNNRHNYRHYNPGPVQDEPRQFYHDDHDPRRYHNDRGDITQNPIPFYIQGRGDHHRIPITVAIRVSLHPPPEVLRLLSRSFRQCNLVGNILTVTGYPDPRSGPDEFLETVRRLTGDRHAYMLWSGADEIY